MNIFRQHAETVMRHYQKIDKEIEQWRLDSIERVNNLAIVQKNILQQDFNVQKGIFEEERKINVAKAADYYRSTSETLFDQLQSDCAAIVFKIAQIKSIKDEFECRVVITGTELETQQQQEKQEKKTAELNSQQNRGAANGDDQQRNNSRSNGDATDRQIQ